LIRIAFDDVAARLVKNLYQMGLQSVIVEGGAKTLESFIKAGLWDEARVFTGLVRFGQGTAAPQIEARIIERTTVGDDQLILYRP
ncbi:MAG TPA: dihydrofolate reductase family protein, partial [Flavobacterium sp.]|nr:dihydrofolate reductase family protein [Flavobacterium sp.]